mgnify:CR=1 FL=1
MKLTLLTAILLLGLAIVASAQEKPLSQAEFVRMLYAARNNAEARQALIEALRRRGIDFEVTDGLRSLTRSKSGNDDELRRTLDQAGRRRQNPTAAKLPSELEAAAILDKTRQKTLEAIGEMPDFVVKQQIQRSAAYAGTGNFRNLDKLIVAVSYRASGAEAYKLLAVNGVPQQQTEARESYEQAGGTSSTGEFVTVLATIFKPESETEFTLVDTDLLRGRQTVVFDFSIARDRARQQITVGNTITQTTVTGMKGRIWIDRELFRVLRIESEATQIPEDFPAPSALRTIDYDWARIAEEKYLLPLVADVRLTIRDKSGLYELRNLIRFTNYQKFGTETIIGPEDSEPVREEKP